MPQSDGFDRRIGMVASRPEHLERIDSYGIRRVELVILTRESEPEVREHLARFQPRLSVHAPLFRESAPDDYPLLASLFDTDPERQERAVSLMERELKQARDWGATHMVVHLQRSVGVLGEAVPAGWDERRALECTLPAALRLAAAAECVGIPIHIENMMSHPAFCRPEAYLALFGALPPQWARMCFDVGHAALDAAKFGFDAVEFARLLAPHVGSLHVYNNQVSDDFDFVTLREQGRIRKHPVHPAQEVGEGWIDVAAMVDAVLTRNPDALVTFEVYFVLDTDREATRAGVEWLSAACRRHWTPGA